MNKEEILAKSRKENREMDEYQTSWYQKAEIISNTVGVLLGSVLIMYCVFNNENAFGYVAILMSILGVRGLIFGIKCRENYLGIINLISGIVCSIAGVFTLILFFIRG